MQKTRITIPALQPSAFQRLPEATRANGVSGYYDTAILDGPYFQTLPGHFLDREMPNPAKGVPDVVERPSEHETLREWRPADLERLGLAEFPELLDSNDSPPPDGGDVLKQLPKGKK